MDRDTIETILITSTFILSLIIIASSVVLFEGCTTVNHDPICKCSCKDNNSSFECRTNYEAHSIDIN